MCDPMTALAIAQGAAAVGAGVQQTKAVNSAARQSYRSALESSASQNVGLDRRYIEEAESFNQQGYDLALQQAAASASARNSGAAGGVAGRTISALVAEQARVGARNASRIQSSRDNAKVALEADKRGIQVQTRDRIQNTPTASYGLSDLLIQGVQTGAQVAGIRKSNARHTERLELLARGEG